MKKFIYLLNYQLVVTIPKEPLKKLVNVIRRKKKVKEAEKSEGVQNDELDEDHEYIDKARSLWIRGAQRIQNEVYFFKLS